MTIVLSRQIYFLQAISYDIYKQKSNDIAIDICDDFFFSIQKYNHLIRHSSHRLKPVGFLAFFFKKQGNKKINWIKSNHYIKIQNQLKELYRKQADILKLQHEKL